MAIRPSFGAVADAFAPTASQTSEWQQAANGDWQLVLTRTAAAGPPAGARIYGLEGLDVSQLGKIGFTVDGGACNGNSPQLALYFDSNGDGVGDGTKTFTCGGGTGVKTFDPMAAGVPGTAVVLGLDLLFATQGTTIVDDIRFDGLGITIVDYLVGRTA
jgi:hypothetical protein